MTSHFDKHGGPAFPQVSTNPDGDLYQPGMTLRDYFAAKCMQGLSALPSDFNNNRDILEMVAKIAYAQADAMLSARSTKKAGEA